MLFATQSVGLQAHSRRSPWTPDRKHVSDVCVCGFLGNATTSVMDISQSFKTEKYIVLKDWWGRGQNNKIRQHLKSLVWSQFLMMKCN